MPNMILKKEKSILFWTTTRKKLQFHYFGPIIKNANRNTHPTSRLLAQCEHTGPGTRFEVKCTHTRRQPLQGREAKEAMLFKNNQ